MVKIEGPDTVHGRLLEAVHISGYSFERACTELNWLLEENRWKQCGEGFEDINAFLETINLADFKIAIDQRKQLATKLKKLEASQRATARALGVDEGTIRKDVAPAEKSAKPKPESLKTKEKIIDVAENSAPAPITQPGNVAAKAAEKAAKKQEVKETPKAEPKPLPLGKFSLLYADPPWQYDFSRSDSRQIENQYPTLNIDEIKFYKDVNNRPVQDLPALDSVLFLWVPPPKLLEGIQVLEAWGFSYVTNAVWNKEKIGMGYYFRQQHELLLVGKRGKFPVPEEDTRPSSIFSSPRSKHSEKPLAVYLALETMYPTATKVELFSRSNREGWTHWGTGESTSSTNG